MSAGETDLAGPRGEIGAVDAELARLMQRWAAAGGGGGAGGLAGEIGADLAELMRGRGGGDAGEAERCAARARELLERRGEAARRIAEAKERGRWAADFRAAEEAGDEERLEALVSDWVAEAQVLERVKRAGAEAGGALSGADVEREWAERIIPWTKRQEVEHLTDPGRGA